MKLITGGTLRLNAVGWKGLFGSETGVVVFVLNERGVNWKLLLLLLEFIELGVKVCVENREVLGVVAVADGLLKKLNVGFVLGDFWTVVGVSNIGRFVPVKEGRLVVLLESPKMLDVLAVLVDKFPKENLEDSFEPKIDWFAGLSTRAVVEGSWKKLEVVLVEADSLLKAPKPEVEKLSGVVVLSTGLAG